MKQLVALSLAVASTLALAAPAKRDIATVRNYIRRCVGEKALSSIAGREGGSAFLKKFLSDQDWMEQFAGSGPWKSVHGNAPAVVPGDALSALDLLAWNDEGGFMATKAGRNAATALALNHGSAFSPEKLVEVMACYREWMRDGTLHPSAAGLDVHQWREVMSFGQNAELPVDSLRWIHDFANLPADRYAALHRVCHYRLHNCFGDSVHGPMYYAPWEHSWNVQELRLRVGGVCGALSKFGSHCAASHGIRAFTAGQPAHCAYLVWDLDADRWSIGNSVTYGTRPHFTLGGEGLAALEEQERYFSDPKRMDAEFLRWKGDYAASMACVPGNWQAADEWLSALAERNAPQQEWDAAAEALRTTFAKAPSQGWQLYFRCLERIKDDKSALVDAVKKGFLAFSENPAETAEAMPYDKIVLDRVSGLLGNDEDSLWKVFPAMLQGQARTRNFYNKTVDWAAAKLMTTPEKSAKLLKAVSRFAAKTGTSLDYGGMILRASQAEDMGAFVQVCSLMEKLAPETVPNKRAKQYPASDYGGELLSAGGMLRTSSTSRWDKPARYRYALLADDYDYNDAFHTEFEMSPWATVVLPGESEVLGVTVANTSTNVRRQAPLCVWTSEDGVDFDTAYMSESAEAEWRVKLPKPVRAKYVRVGRRPDDRNDPFHLHKILVYGRKLY